ncbi:RNA-directed DNA polymerase, eukaryota, reverse transcriptase zinc-binding domain protein [Tanacetum coccineum]
MYVFLPNENNGISSLLHKFGYDSDFFDRHIPQEKVNVGLFFIPKFKISFGFEASDILKELGLIWPFTNGEGLNEMVDSCVGQNLYVSSIYHKSFVEVNEEGREAAGASTTAIAFGSRITNDKVDFVADHPFLFVIKEDVSRAMLFMGQVVDPCNIPFSYLGLPIGSNMNMIVNWQHLIDHFRGKLSSWKANLLSIGGRLTLIKAVLGSLGIYYMSIFKCPESVINALESMRATFFWGGSGDNRKMAWIKWDNILASLDKEALWVRVIKAIHGDEAGFDFQGCNSNSIWSVIISSFSSSHDRDIITSDSLFRKVGNGSSIRFWKDNWDGNGPLSAR